MTTVAFKDSWMASDSKCTDEFGAFFSRVPKIYRLSNGALLGAAGDADIRDVLAILDKATHKKLPSRRELADTHTECSAILAFPSGHVFAVEIGPTVIGDVDFEWQAEVVECLERWIAVGSGAQFAMGAMAAGKSAADAVHVACRFDSFSQAPVKSVAVKPEMSPKATAKAKKLRVTKKPLP